jgi:hypothetical protein
MKNLALESFSVLEMNSSEIIVVNGGGWKEKLMDWAFGYVLDEIADGLQRPCPPCK